MRLHNPILVSCLLFSPAWADLIVLRDGDRITGAILKKDGDNVTVDSKNFGKITFKWAEIESVKSDGPLNVVLTGDRTVKGPISTEDGKVIVNAPTPQTVVPSDIVALRNEAEQRTYERLLHPGLLDLWAVIGSINIAGTKGNADASTLTTPFTLVRATNTSRTTLYFNSIRSSAAVDRVSEQTAQAVRGGWAFNRDLSKKVFLNLFNDYEYDKFQSLDLRVVLGAGLGYKVWMSDRGRLDVLAGGAWNREKFGAILPSREFTRNSAEVYWGDDFAYKVNTRMALTQSFRMFNNATNTGEYRVNADVGLSMAIMRWLSWNVSLSDRYLTNPAPGRVKNDFLYSTGFAFTFVPER
ncbi:MAG TPA: DUF481 domain-containing protein [Bryobacteraceae bacterium]|nr:DUF481 domain-containing protein [Bryobacteraceae bacterium]